MCLMNICLVESTKESEESDLVVMSQTRKRCRRIFRPTWLIFVTICVCCLIHIHQVYTASRQMVGLKKRHKSMLFLSQERKMRQGRALELVVPPQEEDVADVDKNPANCDAKKSVFFLKTHKTGSTTVTNVILRYAEKHHLSVGLPPLRHWQLGGYPSFFDPKIVDPQLPVYDVLCHHMRYDHVTVRKVLPLNAVSVTILRDPTANFESGFSFFRDWPYPQWFDNASAPDSLRRFLDHPDSFYNKSTPWHFRAKNYMSFDLGFDNERDDLQYAESLIGEVEARFNLVMITERMEESLILLKDLLCMDSFDEILHIRLKVRQNSARREVSSRMRDQMMTWNLLDTNLYNHFNKTLDSKIASYGKERMGAELRKFREMLDKIEEKCVLYYDELHLKPWISRIKLKRNSGDFCDKLSWGEVKFGDFIRNFQRHHIDTAALPQLSNDEINQLLRHAQEKVIGEKASLYSA
ncbi:galactosylceramide sulfotransferase-like [Clavelina lepadiformis]|uniref:galactosylceramide sulfotransferase-like n=1 Tax=Clavelina lepadiformis TaxID=159417 RepID=UPI004042E23F